MSPVALLGSLLLGNVAVPPQATPAKPTLEAKVDALARSLAGRDAPSVAIVLRQGPRTLYRKAIGTADRAGKIPATPATPYKIASVTKGFTAAIVQGLEADGKLKVGDAARTYLPELPEPWGGVTIRHLLHHTSGLPEYTTGFAIAILAGGTTTPDAILAWAAKQKPESAPGAKFAYRNTNYHLLGLVAERVGGAPLEALLRARIFAPLGMATAVLPRRGAATPGEAEGSALRGGKLVAARSVDASWPYAAGALVMSVDDLALWLDGVADGKVLSAEARRAAFTPAALSDGELSFYGYGWVLGTRGDAPMLAHAGEIDGFASYVAYLPMSDVRLSVVANGQAVDAQRLAFAILDAHEGKEPAAAIPDGDPKLTARLRAVVVRMLRGERDAAEFDPAFLKRVSEADYAKIGRALGELGALAEFVLVAEEREGGTIRREYRMRVGDEPVLVSFAVGADGRIAGLRLK